MACANCGERDPEKLGIVVKVVKGYAEEKELCRPCWWREVEVRLTGEHGRAIQQKKEVRGDRERIVGKAGAPVFSEGSLTKGVREQGDSEGTPTL